MRLTFSARSAALACIAASSPWLAGCSTVSNTMSSAITSVITPYKVEIVQGNVITKEQIALIKPGRSRNEVRDALGSPLVADPFHAARWDYVFLLRRPGTEPQQRAVVITFDGDVVKTVEAPDDLPGERDFIASITRGRAEESKRKLELTEEERAALPKPAPVAAGGAASSPQGPARTYPPLEAL